MWWMEQRARAHAGPDLHSRRRYLDASLRPLLAAAGWSNEESTLLLPALLRSWRKFETFGCFDDPGVKMRSGRSGIIQRGEFAGEKVEIDHIVAFFHSLEARNFPGNFDPLPRSANRAKQARVRQRDLELARSLHRIGIIESATLERVERAAEKNVLKPKIANRNRTTSSGAVSANSAGISGMDPQHLIRVVIELTHRLEDNRHRWASAMQDSGHALRQSLEAETQIRSWAATIRNQAETDEEAAEGARLDERHWAARLKEVSDQISVASAFAKETFDLARAKVAAWKSEEGDASQWISSAQGRVSRAQSEVNQAYDALREANYEYSAAEAELASARGRTEHVGNDKEGNPIYRPVDTSSYEAAVRRAQAEVNRCQSHLAEAEAELNSAQREFTAANARLSACQKAVNIAQGAVQSAAEATATIDRGMALRERADEEHVRLERLVARSSDLAMRQIETVEEMTSSTSAAEAAYESSSHRVRLADDHASEAQRHTVAGILEIRERMGMLRLFDLPWV